jgi:hypothetical protein
MSAPNVTFHAGKSAVSGKAVSASAAQHQKEGTIRRPGHVLGEVNRLSLIMPISQIFSVLIEIRNALYL